VTGNIRIMPMGKGLQPALTIPVPAQDVVVTTLVVTSDLKELPTLSSVEQIIGRISSLGLVLADSRECDRIAHLINKEFLPISHEDWKDKDLPLHVERADGPGAPEALRAIRALRVPVLAATHNALTAGGAYGPVEQRANEIRLVDDMSTALLRRKPVWLQYGTLATAFIGRTVLDQLVQQIIGVPISDLIRSTLKGAERLVF